VTTLEGLRLSYQLRCNFCEISVLTKHNLEIVRRQLGQMIVEFTLSENTRVRHAEELKFVPEIDIARFISGMKS
jgi:hypothetical protein